MPQQNRRSTQDDYTRMTTAPVGGLILSMAVPAMITTAISSIYNLVDTFFVGRLGTSATAAVGVVFSLVMVMMALGFWSGTGGSTFISQLLGAREDDHAAVVANTSFFMSFLFGAAVALVGLLGGAPLMRLLGATETILPYALTYSRYILLAAPFTACNLAFGQALRAEGRARESMIGQISGGLLNMVLDPLFIFGLRGGIGGAALATALSTFISWCVNVSFYLRGKTQLPLSLRRISRDPADYTTILRFGIPSLCRHGCNMLSNIVLNTVAGGWGDAAIAAMSVCGRLVHFSNAVSLGMNQGSQPVIGYASGMGSYRRMKDAYWFSVRAGVASMVGFGVLGAIFAPQLIGLFRDDPDVIAIGTTSLRLICLALPFGSYMGATSTLFQVTGQPLPSSAILFGRQIVLYIPALLVLPRLLDLLGLQLAGPLSDILVACIALPMALAYFRRLDRKQAA